MSINAWTFLVSRNQELDYRSVIIPDFLCSDGSTKLLEKVADEDVTLGEHAIYREIHNSILGEMSVIFRVSIATNKYLGLEGENVLIDSYGRKISFIEGIVMRNFISNFQNIKVPNKVFDEIHEQASEAYKVFWQWTTYQPPLPSTFFPISFIEKKDIGFTLTSKKPYILKQKTSVSKLSETVWNFVKKIPTVSEVNGVCFSPNDPLLLSIRCRHIVQVLNLPRSESEDPIIIADFREIPIMTSPNFSGVVFSPTGKLIAASMIQFLDSNSVKIWDWENKKEKLSINDFSNFDNGRITCVAFSCDELFLASGIKDGSIKISDIKSGGKLLERKAHKRSVLAISFSPDGDFLASGGEDGMIKIWSYRNLKESKSFNIKNPVMTLTYSPDGSLLAAGDNQGYTLICDIKNDRNSQFINIDAYPDSAISHFNSINTICFSPDGRLLATGGDDNEVKIWDIEKRKCLQSISGHKNKINSITFSCDGKTIATGSNDESVMIWRLQE